MIIILIFFNIFLILQKLKLKKNFQLKKFVKNYHCKQKKLSIYNEICLKDEKKKIIVSLTSWPKRIFNVATVINSLLNQEIKPDLIELNLSILEFPKKEKNLPKDLNLLLKNNKNIEINWTQENTGVFKKIIPTIQKFYGMDYYLLSVDDDWIYSKRYIKTMIYYIEKYNADSFCLGRSKVIGNRMIYKSIAFELDFITKLTDDVINAKISDLYILYYLKQKKKYLTHRRPRLLKKFMLKFNPISPNSGRKKGKYSSRQINRAIRLIKEIKFI
jgi:hypothetical protein